jgi:hypothetical protein
MSLTVNPSLSIAALVERASVAIARCAVDSGDRDDLGCPGARIGLNSEEPGPLIGTGLLRW